MKSAQQKLLEDEILTENQFDYLEKIDTNQIVSVYFELRSLLYIGVLLLTTGIGFIIYLNMGQVAHLALIAVMLIGEGFVFWYVQKHALAYSNTEQKSPTPYFDYVVLFGALLVISIFSYTLIQYDLLETFIEWSSLISSVIFFLLAFRYDHRGVLALAITAFAAFWGLSVSPVEWTHFDFIDMGALHNTGIGIGLLLFIIGTALKFKNIKVHFAFTFQNFGLILFFISITSALVEDYNWGFYAWGSVLISLLVSIASWKKQEYLFFVYSSIAGYIAFTRLLIEIADDVPYQLWFFYIMVSMGGLVFMVERIISRKRKNRIV